MKKKYILFIIIVLFIVIGINVLNDTKLSKVIDYKSIEVIKYNIPDNQKMSEQDKDNIKKLVNIIDPYAKKITVHKDNNFYTIYCDYDSNKFDGQIGIVFNDNKEIIKLSLIDGFEKDLSKQHRELIMSEEYLTKIIKEFNGEDFKNFKRIEDKEYLQVKYINEKTGTNLVYNTSNTIGGSIHIYASCDKDPKGYVCEKETKIKDGENYEK